MNFYKKLKDFFKQISIFEDISSILEWDMATMMPSNSRFSRITQLKILTKNKKEIFNQINELNLLNKINEKELDNNDLRNLKLMKKKIEIFSYIPSELLIKNQKLSIECEGKWREAKKKNNFNVVKREFAKLFKSITEKSKILSDLWGVSEYDALLSLYDQSFKSEEITKFAADIEFFIKKKYDLFIANQKKKKILEFDNILNDNEQLTLSKYVMKKFGFKFNKGRVDTSMHPFCGGNSEDIRITTKFNKNDFFSSFDALMHETGHALYEFGLPKSLKNQLIGKAGGMSLHESQSLFIEMQIVKTKEFNKFLEKLLKRKFNRCSLPWKSKNLYNSRMKIKKGFIRIEADEVHYPLHIIHRFNLEKKLLGDEKLINSLPDLWNFEFKRIFDIDVNSDNNGCLQDIHWFSGDVGYFPTYLVGAMIAAQLKNSLNKDLSNINEIIETGNFKVITSWLKKNIHNFGNRFSANELLQKVSGEKLNSNFYKNHLKNRYLN